MCESLNCVEEKPKVDKFIALIDQLLANKNITGIKQIFGISLEYPFVDKLDKYLQFSGGFVLK